MTTNKMFEDYISINIDRIYRFAYTFTRNREDAEDIVNDSVIKALNSLKTLKNTDVMGPWFYRIVTNTAITYLRKKNRIVYLDPADMEEALTENENFDRLDFEEIIDKLDYKYKSVLVLRFFEDMPLSDIAFIQSENLNTIKTRLYRALKLLKIEMEASI